MLQFTSSRLTPHPSPPLTATTLLTLIGICVLGAMTPGASLAVVVHQTLRHGRGHGLAAAVAHGLAVGLYAFAAVTGLGLLYAQSPIIQGTVAGLGGAYLLVMAWKLWWGESTAVSEDEPDTAPMPATSLAGSARAGFLIAILNPKIAIFFLALFSQLASPDFGWPVLLLMASIAGVIDLVWYVLVALVLSRTGVIDRIRSHHRLLDRITAVLLAAIAVVVIVQLFN